MDYIPFEKPFAELENKIFELRRIATTEVVNLDAEIEKLENQARMLRQEMFRNLTAYQAAQISRHPNRPNTLELIQLISEGFIELHGDRNFDDDKAIIGGLTTIGTIPVVIMGHQKGRGTKENIARNFGMAKPEGYRKALRLMSMAERFRLPIITLIDTPGAYPGVGAEERGQSEAIGKNIMVMSKLKIPIISIVIGEGGSGGALALGVGNKVHMLQYATYSVISPEGCASILLKNASRAAEMAESLKLTANWAKEFGLIDEIIEEPEGGAHRNHELTALRIKQQILRDLLELKKLGGEELRVLRFEKFTKMGVS